MTENNAVAKLPLLTVNAGTADGDKWTDRLKEEYMAIIKYVQSNKEADNDWFEIAGNSKGTRWEGKCWYIHNLLKYTFKVEFEIPVTYPQTSFDICLPELEGKTAKMYQGGKICLTDHFKPLWAKHVPHYGIAHALALGLGPWLAAEVPHLVEAGLITPDT